MTICDISILTIFLKNRFTIYSLRTVLTINYILINFIINHDCATVNIAKKYTNMCVYIYIYINYIPVTNIV